MREKYYRAGAGGWSRTRCLSSDQQATRLTLPRWRSAAHPARPVAWRKAVRTCYTLNLLFKRNIKGIYIATNLFVSLVWGVTLIYKHLTPFIKLWKQLNKYKKKEQKRKRKQENKSN